MNNNLYNRLIKYGLCVYDADGNFRDPKLVIKEGVNTIHQIEIPKIASDLYGLIYAYADLHEVML